MSRTTASDAIHESFVSALRELGASVETMADLAAGETNEQIRAVFLGLGRAKRELLLVREVGFLNVHVRADPPGWWGIQSSVKSDLDFLADKLGLKCYYVLLVGRPSRRFSDGYIGTDFSSQPFLRPPKEISGKFTVNERDLDPARKLLSVEKIARTLLGLGTTASQGG